MSPRNNRRSNDSLPRVNVLAAWENVRTVRGRFGLFPDGPSARNLPQCAYALPRNEHIYPKCETEPHHSMIS